MFRLSCALVAAVLLGGAVSAGAQTPTFNGRVVDGKTQVPVAGASVVISGFAGVVKTDAEGRFTVAGHPQLPFQIIVILPSGQVARPFDVTSIDAPVTDVPVNPVTDEAVTVIGAAPSVDSSPASATSLLSAAQITSRAPENLMQVLETVPGVNAVSEGHATVPAIRGLARGRTLLLIDGARVTSERRVGPSATFADPASFEGIDVARGPGSVAYGSDALGGVVSVRTRRAEPGSPLRVRGSGTIGGGIPEVRGTFEVSKGLARGGILLQTHAREAEDWDSPVDDERVFNSGWRDRGVLVRLDHQVGPGVLSAGWQSDFARDVERPRNNSRTVRFYYPYENSHRFTSSYEANNVGGFPQLMLTGFIGTVQQRTDQDRFPTAASLRAIERADISARDFHVKGSGVRVVGPARIEFGVDVNGRFGLEATDTNLRYDLAGGLASRTDNISIDDARRTDSGAYVQAEANVSRAVRLAAGLRGDYVTTRNRGGYFGDRATSNSAFSGFTSITAGPFNGVSVTGQVSRGFRDPTLSDRYYRGPTGRGFITGNPDLDPETSLQVDVAARYAISRTQIAAYAYHYRITDLVERYSTDADFFFFRNQGRARLRGIELEARTEIGAGFSFEGGVNLSQGIALDTDTPLDDIAPPTLVVMARQDFGSTVFAQVRASFFAEDDTPGPSEVSAPAARVVDLSTGWKLSRHVELRGIVRNLLDEAYYASPDPRWVYAPGRSGSVTLAFNF